jgi:hypothetical protein
MESSMNVGVSVSLPAYNVDLVSMAHKAKELPFKSLWCAEPLFIPAPTASRFPDSADGINPESYSPLSTTLLGENHGPHYRVVEYLCLQAHIPGLAT